MALYAPPGFLLQRATSSSQLQLQQITQRLEKQHEMEVIYKMGRILYQSHISETSLAARGLNLTSAAAGFIS